MIRYEEVNMTGLVFGIGFIMMNVIAVGIIAAGFEFVSWLINER
jgi:hypothetical protein